MNVLSLQDAGPMGGTLRRSTQGGCTTLILSYLCSGAGTMQQHDNTQMHMQTTHQGSGSSSPLALMCWQHGDHACSQHATTHSGMSQVWHHHPFAGMCAGRPGPPRVPRVCSTFNTPLSLTHSTPTTHHNNAPERTSTVT
jgi:hypothetical protein